MEKYIGKRWGSLSDNEQKEFLHMIAYCENTYEKDRKEECVIYFENDLKINGYIKNCTIKKSHTSYEIDIMDDEIFCLNE